MDWRGWTGKIVDLVYLEQNGFNDIVTDQLKARVIEEWKDVLAPAGEEVVEANDIMAFADQTLTKMRANKAGTAGD
jgi:hypothetical protein